MYNLFYDAFVYVNQANLANVFILCSSKCTYR